MRSMQWITTNKTFRTAALWVAVFFAFHWSGSAQNDRSFHAGVKLGINTSQMTGDGYGGFFKFSPIIGGFANHRLNDKLKFQYELYYQQKGSHQPARPDKGFYNSYKIRLHYIEIPFLWQFQLKKFELEAGPGVGFMFHAQEFDSNGEVKNLTTSWRNFELDAMIGANYYMDSKERLFVNVRVHHSVTSVVSSTLVTPAGIYGGAWNVVIGASINYRF
ncbi:PorT family protein [bacterium SCSIO 12741]|nr:PorT family protein [bacterium SCSIO 12741]